MSANAPLDPAVETLVARLEARLAAAHAALAAGVPADLEGLDREMAALRDRAAGLPADAAAGLRPRLISLLEEIDRLTDEFRRGLDTVAQQIGESGRRRQAVSAYSQTPAPGAAAKPGKPGGKGR